MNTVGFVGYKGGSGKSTCAANCAIVAAFRGYRVVLIDLDEQGSLVTWASLRRIHGPEVIAMPARDLHGFIRQSRYDLCFVDVPGHDWGSLRVAASLADLSVIVARPTSLDIDVAITVRDALEQWRREWVMLLNQVPPRETARLVGWTQAYAALGAVMVPGLPSLFAFQDAMARGLGVSEYAPGARADLDVRQAARWIMRRIGVRP